MTFTKEQLIGFAENIIATAAKYPTSAPAQADKRLAEIALAALTAKPVAYLFPGSAIESPQLGFPDDLDDGQKTNCQPLYATQSALVVPIESSCKYCGGSGYFRWQQSANMCPCPCLGCTELANGGE